VIVNRLLPGEIADPWFDAWRATQRDQLETIESAFTGVPVIRAELAADELVGPERLSRFGAALYGDQSPAARLCATDPLRVDTVDDSLVLSMHLPFTHKGDVELARSNGELLLAVGAHRRAVTLPESLRRREVAAARMAGDRLEVEFTTREA
jgi:arsenite/tail-anchored protein-transporting ATPase